MFTLISRRTCMSGIFFAQNLSLLIYPKVNLINDAKITLPTTGIYC